VKLLNLIYKFDKKSSLKKNI